jgi:hypothetical protein
MKNFPQGLGLLEMNSRPSASEFELRANLSASAQTAI